MQYGSVLKISGYILRQTTWCWRRQLLFEHDWRV